jgi:hypothetical protein
VISDSVGKRDIWSTHNVDLQVLNNSDDGTSSFSQGVTFLHVDRGSEDGPEDGQSSKDKSSEKHCEKL